MKFLKFISKNAKRFADEIAYIKSYMYMTMYSVREIPQLIKAMGFLEALVFLIVNDIKLLGSVHQKWHLCCVQTRKGGIYVFDFKNNVCIRNVPPHKLMRILGLSPDVFKIPSKAECLSKNRRFANKTDYRIGFMFMRLMYIYETRQLILSLGFEEAVNFLLGHEIHMVYGVHRNWNMICGCTRKDGIRIWNFKTNEIINDLPRDQLMELLHLSPEDYKFSPPDSDLSKEDVQYAEGQEEQTDKHDIRTL